MVARTGTARPRKAAPETQPAWVADPARPEFDRLSLKLPGLWGFAAYLESEAIGIHGVCGVCHRTVTCHNRLYSESDLRMARTLVCPKCVPEVRMLIGQTGDYLSHGWNKLRELRQAEERPFHPETAKGGESQPEIRPVQASDFTQIGWDRGTWDLCDLCLVPTPVEELAQWELADEVLARWVCTVCFGDPKVQARLRALVRWR